MINLEELLKKSTLKVWNLSVFNRNLQNSLNKTGITKRKSKDISILMNSTKTNLEI
jgi:hypothetical protein